MWMSPNRRTRNDIYFSPTNDVRVITDVGILKELKFPSDHRSVHTTISIPCRTRIRDAISSKNKINVSSTGEIHNLIEFKELTKSIGGGPWKWNEKKYDNEPVIYKFWNLEEREVRVVYSVLPI